MGLAYLALLCGVCGGLVGLITYFLQKKSRHVSEKQKVLSNFLIIVSQFQKDLMQEERDFKKIINSIFKEVYKISTEYKDLCVLQKEKKSESKENDEKNAQEIEQVDRLISELILPNSSTINIIELIKSSDEHMSSSEYSFQSLLIKQIKSDIFQKKIQLEEVYLLQILMILLNIYPILDGIKYVCFQARYTEVFMTHLRCILIQRLSEQTEETILEIYENLFKTDDSKADERTLIQIYSLPNISLENKKIFLKRHIFELNKESSSTLLMSSLSQFDLNENNSGDFMIRIKRLIELYANKG